METCNLKMQKLKELVTSNRKLHHTTSSAVTETPLVVGPATLYHMKRKIVEKRSKFFSFHFSVFKV